MLAGRGFGKTRVGAEDLSDHARTHRNCRYGLVGQTRDDVRDTMVEGESGLLNVLPTSALRGRSVEDGWNRSQSELYLSNGCVFRGYSSERPGRLRGPQFHRVWGDEPAEWLDADAGTAQDTTWSNLTLALRLGDDPRVVLTGTPKPKQLIRELLDDDATLVTRGSTYENLDNLAPTMRRAVLNRYEGTRLGRQEIGGELLTDVPGSFWTYALIDLGRVKSARKLTRVVVAVDPAVTATETSDETGIVVAGKGVDGHAYVLEDVSCRLSPSGWARRVIGAYDRHQADLVVAEKNNGGDLVETNLRAEAQRQGRPPVPYEDVWAKRNKQLRAQPVANLYGDPDRLEESNPRVHHVGTLDRLEDQQTTWTPESGQSPDRLDALVYAVQWLLLESRGPAQIEDVGSHVSISPI